MATVSAKLSDYRQAPRKVRLLAGLIRGKRVDEALLELSLRAKRAAPAFEKLVRSAVANAKAQGLDEKSLIVKEIRVDKGVVLKRFMPRAQGRAARINKRSSHILVVLESKDVEPVKKPAAKTTAKPAKAAKSETTAKKATKAKPKK